MKIRPLIAVLLVSVALGACKSKEVKPESTEGAGVGQDVTVSGTGVQYGPDGKPLGTGEMGAAGDLLAQKRVYFAYDSADLDEESRRIIEAHARYLAANPDIKVVLEGHTDERGSREYNLALGERRAKAVAGMFTVLGVVATRINSVSYGEEKPVALGHDDSAWRLNRRVEIMYGNY